MPGPLNGVSGECQASLSAVSPPCFQTFCTARVSLSVITVKNDALFGKIT